MNVFVTGAFDNIGTSAVDELLRQGHRVRCLVRPSQRNRRRASRFGDRVEMCWGDIRQIAGVEAAVRDQDVMVHLAGILPRESVEVPQLARETNVDGTRNLLAAARGLSRPPRFLFASSFDVFGHTQHLPPPRRVGDRKLARGSCLVMRICRVPA
jgi:nucleoside-diphosphate-sugar epimerase